MQIVLPDQSLRPDFDVHVTLHIACAVSITPMEKSALPVPFRHAWKLFAVAMPAAKELGALVMYAAVPAKPPLT